MKLSKKIEEAHGKGAPWYSHARQLEAQLEVERGERDDLAQLAKRQALEITNLKAERDRTKLDAARPRPRLPGDAPDRAAPVDFFEPDRVLLVEYPEGQEPNPAIVIGAPETPCVPERDGKHEWYSDGKGGAFCRRCGLQTIRKGGDS